MNHICESWIEIAITQISFCIVYLYIFKYWWHIFTYVNNPLTMITWYSSCLAVFLVNIKVVRFDEKRSIRSLQLSDRKFLARRYIEQSHKHRVLTVSKNQSNLVFQTECNLYKWEYTQLALLICYLWKIDSSDIVHCWENVRLLSSVAFSNAFLNSKDISSVL